MARPVTSPVELPKQKLKSCQYLLYHVKDKKIISLNVFKLRSLLKPIYFVSIEGKHTDIRIAINPRAGSMGERPFIVPFDVICSRSMHKVGTYCQHCHMKGIL